MKRILGLFILLFGLYSYFSPQKTRDPQLDVIKLKMSAIQRAPSKSPSAIRALSKTAEAPKQDLIEEKIVEESHVSELPEDELTEDDELAENSDIPWDEIKSGWRDHLKNVLSELDPENGEEIYTSYLAENTAFEIELENLSNGRSVGSEDQIGDLENRHEEKLKSILGRHYREVTDQHEQYNSSLQYMNHSKHQVSVSL